ncbi:MAG: hypothetical protein IJ987_01315 [Firmicutes bacterium]|nr:hypothetical protein [Bacillota bacterium]
MKTKKTILIVCIMMIGLMLSAFTMLPKLSFTDVSTTVDVTYLGATKEDDHIIVDINYDSNDNPFIIARDIEVATDSNFVNVLEFETCMVEDEKYVYTFDLGENESVDNIFIKPPVLYMPDAVETSTVKASKNSVMRTETGDTWFTVNDIAMEERETFYLMNVIIDPVTGDLPRYPELLIGDEVYYGNTAMKFDINGDFCEGQFIFILPKDTSAVERVNGTSESSVEKQTDMTIRISNALNRVEADQTIRTSNVKTLAVIEK